MRFPTLLSAASFALAVAPAIAQQHQDMRDEIRRIVREEVRAAVHDAIQELHGGTMEHREPGEHREGQEGQRVERPLLRRLMQVQGEAPELRELEGEMKELEATLEKLQGEVGKRIGAEVHGLQPLLRAKLDGQKPEESGGKPKALKLAPGVFKVEGGEGKAIELKVDGGEMHVVTPKGQQTFQFHIDGDGEAGAKDEKAEAPKTRKSAKSGKTPMGLNTITLPMVGHPIALRSGDGCNCVIVIRCENGQCHIETSCNGQPLTPVQSKTKATKAKKAKGSDDDDDDDDDDGNSSLKVEVKTDAGCCETTTRSANGCCETTTAKTGKGDCCGCCEPKTETTKTGAKEAPKKQIN